MEDTTPTLFKHGTPALVKLIVLGALSVTLMIADARYHALLVVRQAISVFLYPIEMVAQAPRDSLNQLVRNFDMISSLRSKILQLQRQHLLDANLIQQLQRYQADNRQLLALFGAHQSMPVPSIMADVLYDARDPFVRKIVINRGNHDHVLLGQPVIDAFGVVGQVTEVAPWSSEVTLITDNKQSISVRNVRNELRSVAFGLGASGILELRFLSSASDVKVGDTLVTSGLDGVFPAGLNVAKVTHVQTDDSGGFSHVLCQPIGGIDKSQHLLILQVDSNLAKDPYVKSVLQPVLSQKTLASMPTSNRKVYQKNAVRPSEANPLGGQQESAMPTQVSPKFQ